MNTGDCGENWKINCVPLPTVVWPETEEEARHLTPAFFSGYITVNELSGPDPAAIALMSEGEPPR